MLLEGILIVVLGLFMTIKPRSIPNLHHFLFEDGDFSDSYYTFVRITGCILVLLGIVLIVLAFF